MPRMTPAQLQAEQKARDAFFRQANHQVNRRVNCQVTHQDIQADRLIDRGLVAWWN